MSYDKLKDEHVGHTEENPDPFCKLCQRKNWTNEEERAEKKRLNQLKREKQKIEDLLAEFQEVKQEIEQEAFTTPSMVNRYNRKLQSLHEKGFARQESLLRCTP